VCLERHFRRTVQAEDIGTYRRVFSRLTNGRRMALSLYERRADLSIIAEKLVQQPDGSMLPSERRFRRRKVVQDAAG
jgi:hypothetical protein